MHAGLLQKFTGPSTRLVKKRKKYVWIEDCNAVFDELMNGLTTSLILATYQTDWQRWLSLACIRKRIRMCTNAHGQMIVYASRQLKPHEKN